MKKLLAIFLTILLLSGCAATYDGPTESKYVLTEYEVHHTVFDTIDYTNRSQYAYDIYGNRVREMEYQDDELESVVNRKFDHRGNCIREVYWDHSGWLVRFERRVEKTFDEQDRLLSYVVYDLFGRTQSQTHYTYDDESGTRITKDESGIIQTAWLDENGNEIREVAGEYETVYEYDERGFLTGWISYQNGALLDSYKARYDEQGRQIWGGRYNANGELESQTRWEYDDEAHTCTTYRPNDRVRIEYYDADGRLHYIEDYDDEGTISMVQRYYYTEIQVPADGKE